MRNLILIGFLFSLATTGSVFSQRGGFAREPDYFPLGGIEALGIVSEAGDKASIEIKEVLPGGTAAKKNGLKVGDSIVSIGQKRLSGKEKDDVINRFCKAIEKVEGGRKPNKLKLGIKRHGQKMTVELTLDSHKPFSNSDPNKCKKTAGILAESWKYLASRQQDTGQQKSVSNQNHAVATASLCALAWMGSGKKKYSKNIQKSLDFVMENAGKERSFGGMGASSKGKANWNQSNWSLSYAAIFLSEHFAKYRKKSVKIRLQEIIRKIEENQEESGGWAHGPGGPNALNYLELEIMSNLALGGMGMAKRCGVEVDNATAVKAYHYVKRCTQGGGVAYSPKPGQFGSGDPGRTAGAFWALKQMGKGKDLTDSMAKFYSRGLEELYEGHACPTMHVLNGALASALQGKKAYSKYWKQWRPWFMASRTQDGAFGCRPNHESRQMGHHTDRSWGPSFVTAHYVLAMQLGQGRYKLLDTLSKKQ